MMSPFSSQFCVFSTCDFKFVIAVYLYRVYSFFFKSLGVSNPIDETESKLPDNIENIIIQHYTQQQTVENRNCQPNTSLY